MKRTFIHLNVKTVQVVKVISVYAETEKKTVFRRPLEENCAYCWCCYCRYQHHYDYGEALYLGYTKHEQNKNKNKTKKTKKN